MSRITWQIIGAFGNRHRAIVYVDGFQVATKAFATYAEAMAWAMDKETELAREVKER